MDASFQASSIATIGGHVRHRRQIYHCLFTAAALSAGTYVITWDCSHWPLHMGGRGVIKTCRLLTAAAQSSRSDVVRIVFSMPMSSSLSVIIGPTAVRKKVARALQGVNIRGGHQHLQIGRMLDIDLISEPPHVPSPPMYASKVWESVWPEGQEAIHS